MTLENIAQDVICITENLEWLRSKHSEFDGTVASGLLSKNSGALDEGKEQADVLLKAIKYIRQLQDENLLLKLQVTRLEENNAFVIDDLVITKKKLQANEQNVNFTIYAQISYFLTWECFFFFT